MERRYSSLFLTILLVSCHLADRSSTESQLISRLDPTSTRSFVWTETGVVLTLLKGWRRDDDGDDKTQRAWIGLDRSRFSVTVNTTEALAAAGIRVTSRPIHEETMQFYKDHNGEEDLRYLEIDGVRGVHYIRDDKGRDANYEMQDEKFIIWTGQRMFEGQRQVINVTLSASVSNFNANRETLYGLLQSIKFSQEPLPTTEASGDQPAERATSDLSNSDVESTGNHVVSIGIVSNEQMYLGKRRVPRNEIATEVDRLLRDQPKTNQIVYMKALPDVQYGTIARLINDLKVLGYEKFGFIANQKKDSSPPKGSSASEIKSTRMSMTPGSGSQKSNTDGNLVVVTLNSSRTGTLVIKISEMLVGLNELRGKVRELLNGRPYKGVIVRAEGTVTYGLLVPVIDELKAGGAGAIGLELKQ